MLVVSAVVAWAGAGCVDTGPLFVDAETSEDAPDLGPDLGPELPPEPLAAVAGEDRYALVGEKLILDGGDSTGAVSFSWDLGNGETREGAKIATHYDEPGRYKVVLTAAAANGAKKTDQLVVSVTNPATFAPRGSSTIALVPGTEGGTERVAVASPDSDEVTIVERGAGDDFSVALRLEAPGRPRTVTPWNGRLLVPCEEAGRLRVLDPAGGAAGDVAFPRGSKPFGATWTDGGVFVSLQATGRVARITPELEVAETWDVTPDARAIAALPDGRVAVTRWRSPQTGGETGGAVAVLDPGTGAVETWNLAFDPQPASDTEIGGVPSFLAQILVAPTADLAVVPSLQANVGDGLFRSGVPFAHDTVVRAVVSTLALPGGAEPPGGRLQLDNRGFAASGVFSSRGDFLFVADRGSRSIDRIDVLARARSGSILDAGYAPEGLALSPDDRLLYVDATLSRAVRVYDVSDWSTLPLPVAELPIPSAEPLPPDVLRGKQLFGDSLDPRLSKDGYVACAHCHLDGEADGFTWDFTQRGEGLRQTQPLLGRPPGAPIHWSANFDEVQDFEHDLRFANGGLGLMADADFHAGTRDTTLGDPKAGVSADLDALAAFVESLTPHPPSPFRNQDGSLTAEALAGKAIFESPETGCSTCHAGPSLSDSAFAAPGEPVLHDVGTLGPGSGQRLGGPLPGLDTPGLAGLWRSAPYLHDGSAAALRDVLVTRNPADQHGKTSHLTEVDLGRLEAWLLSIDGSAD